MACSASSPPSKSWSSTITVFTPSMTLDMLVTVYTLRWGRRRLPLLTPPSRTDW